MKSAVVWILRVLVGGSLILAALSKIKVPFEFFRALRGYALVPEPLLVPLTYLTPGLELVAGIALLTGFARRAGWAWAVFFGSGFVFFVASAWVRGLDVTCGCFGGKSPLSVATLVRSIVFLLLAVLGACLDRPRVTVR